MKFNINNWLKRTLFILVVISSALVLLTANMDTGLLNLEEHFPTCYVYEEAYDPSSSNDNNRSYFNEWEDERELNGDIGLIPESSSFCQSLKGITDSPPSLLFHKMIDWSSFICVDGVEPFPHEAMAPPLPDAELQNIEQKPQSNESQNSVDDKEINNFDLTTYINEVTSANKSQRKVKSTGKKIDREAQKYIIEDGNEKLDTSDEVDVETVFEGASLPVLEANDAFSLLEQFEASEEPNLCNAKHHENLSSTDSFDFSNSLVNNLEMAVNQIPINSIEIFDKVPQTPIDIFEEDVNHFEEPPASLEEDITNEKTNLTTVEQSAQNESPSIIKSEEVETKAVIKSSETNTYVKSKQILEALPQELIQRINESGKRKTITVIPPIPNKKRTSSRSIDNVSQHRNKIQKTVPAEPVQFDHDYCVAPSPYPKEPQKDSGFQSSEEDDRSVIRNQPTVKTADGKLMVSLLKVNTIRNNNQKKKLNLEEYKKRRFINLKASRNNAPATSVCSAPLPEDENLKRLQHQEKLMQMAVDLLNTTAKTAKPIESDTPAIKPPVQVYVHKISPDAVDIVPPPDFEVKMYVSIGTNTDVSSINCSKTILASAQQLEEIKPLLEKVSNKINSNSFITSLIENIPKVKTKTTSFVKSENQEAIRENKIIHYLKKDRIPVETRSVGSQTTIDEIGVDDDMQSRYRRRIDVRRSPSSSSASSSRSHRRRRSSSSSSRHSRSSRSSDSSLSHSFRSSRSRSRSISPKRPRQYSAERLREVEERRVVYVGRISKGTSKEDLRRRFMPFGAITNVSLHFRDFGDNYGFVTFANKEDAYQAVEHGNDGHAYPKYDLSFGGRRIFCKTSYSDLDNMREDDYHNYYAPPRAPENSFDALLKAAQEKLRKRKP